MLHCYRVFFFSMSVCNNCFKSSNFEIPILKHLERFYHFSGVQTQYEILLSVLLLGTHNASSTLVFLAFILQEDKAHMQLSHPPHKYPS
jgi:hypothetical protein